jgi:hypothetical protein
MCRVWFVVLFCSFCSLAPSFQLVAFCCVRVALVCGSGWVLVLTLGSNVLILLQISEICVLSITYPFIEYFRDIYRLQILLV